LQTPVGLADTTVTVQDAMNQRGVSAGRDVPQFGSYVNIDLSPDNLLAGQEVWLCEGSD
jgi:hypothetical protein